MKRLGLAGAVALTVLIAPAANAAPADLDPTFGTGGIATAAAGRVGAQSDPIVQPSGKVVVVGVNGSADKAVIERFTPGGALDTSFGTGGEVTTDLTPAFGRVAVAATDTGAFQVITGSESQGKITLERFSVDGALQSKVTATVPGGLVWPTAAVIRPDGSTYIAAKFDCSGTYCFGVAKIKNAALDTTFVSGKGYATTKIGSYARPLDLAVTAASDGTDRITVVGSAGYPGLAAADTALLRYKNTGALDTTFDTDGIKTVDLSGAGQTDWATGVAVGATGAVTISGAAASKGVVARFTSTGAADSSFGTAGVVRGGFAPTTVSYGAADVLLDSAGRALVPGRTSDSSTGVAKWTLSRLTTTGAFDTSFTPGGTIQYGPCGLGNNTGPFGVAIGTGRIHLSGGCNADSRTAVARLLTGPLFTGATTLSLSSNSEAAGRELIKTANLDPAAVMGAAERLQGTGLRFNGLRFNGLRFNGLRFNGLQFVGLRFNPITEVADQVLLSEFPLLNGKDWTQLLAGYIDRPLNTITLQEALASGAPGVQALTADDFDYNLTPLRDTAAASWLLANRPLSALPAPAGGWCAYLAGKALDCTKGVDVNTTTLIDLDLALDLSDYYANPLLLAAPTDLGTGDSRAPLSLFELRHVVLGQTPLGAIPAAQVASLLACNPNCTGTLADQQQANPQTFSTATLGQLIARLPVPALANVSLGQVMRGIVPSESIPFEKAPQASLLDQAEFRTTNLQTYTVAGYTVDCAQAGGLIATVELPGDARVVPGSAQVTAGGTTTAVPNPTAAGVFDLSGACQGQGGATVSPTLTFKVEPGSELGQRNAKATVSSGSSQLSSASASTTVDDSLDSGDDPAQARLLPVGDIVTSHISSPTDVDYYRVPAPSPGSRLTVKLNHLPADYDVSIVGPALSLNTAGLRFNGLRFNGLRFNPVPDASLEALDQSQPADTVQDIGLRFNPVTQSVRSNSINRGTLDEAASVVATSADQGADFIVAVTPFNGANGVKKYDLSSSIELAPPAPACQGPSLSGGAGHSLPDATAVPNDARTLLLVNEQRMTARDGATPTGRVMTRLAQVAAATNGVVVPVDVPQTAAAYAALDASPCSVTAANGVANAINGVVDKLRTDNGGLPNLRTIQIVGPDAEIPFVRAFDQTEIGNETSYADEAAVGNVDSPSSRAQREGYLLTDDGYGDFDPGQELFVPDVALGRVVEDAPQIADQLDAFLASGGVVNPGRTYVAGYDFLSDGAQRTFAALNQRSAGQLLLDNWTADQARDGLNGSAVFGSVNGHADHSRLLPGTPGGRLLDVSEVNPAAGSVLFTVGCHAGLNLTVTDDWADHLGARSVLYAANTGYGYGDTEAVAYSETVMADYAANLAGGTMTPGQALMFAKQKDAAALSTSDDYWNKSLMEATFYGLAMYRVGPGGAEAQSVLPKDLNGQPNAVRASSTYTITPNFTRHDTDSGSYWTADGEDPLAIQHRPLQPKTTVDVTPDDLAPVHGAIIESLATTEVSGVNHVISRPVLNDSATETEPDSASSYFPSQLLSTQAQQTPNGPRERLTLAAGQARDGVQRLLTNVKVRVFRSRSGDYTPNVITRVDGLVKDGGYSLTVDVTGGGEDGGRVLFRTDAGPDWTSAPLATVAPGRLGAGGPLPGGGTKIVEAKVYVYDVNGNVAYSDFKVVGYSFDPVPVLPGEPKLTLAPAPPASGYYSTPPSVSLDPGTHGNANFEYSVDSGAWKPYSGPFTVSAPTEGEHIVRVRGTDGSSGFNRFAVDTTGPSVTASATTAPNANGWYSGPVTVHFDCADAVSGVATCPADKTITAEGANQSATGTATDRAGLSGSGGINGINIDKTKPAITAKADRAANADGWYKDPVTVSFTCTDALSGVDFCAPNVVVAEAQDGSASGDARDKAGNTATAAITGIRVDRQDPSAAITSSGLLLLSNVTGTAGDVDATNPKAVSGVKEVKVTYTKSSGGTPVVKTATLSCNADRSSCSWTAAPPPFGSWTVTAVTTDKAGRAGPAAQSTISINF